MATTRNKKEVKTKKAPKTKTVTKVTEVKKDNSKSTPRVQFKLDKQKLLKALLYTVVFVVSLGVIDLVVQYLNNDFSAAVVNGQRVSKNEFHDRLTKAYGVQAVAALVDEALIEQEGATKGVTVTQKEVDDRMKDIANQLGGEKELDKTLASNNITRSDIERQIKLEIIATKVLKPTLKYEEKDVEDFFNQYKSMLYQEDVTFEDKKVEVEETFIGQKVEEAKTAWLEELRNKAKIQNNVSNKPTYGLFKTMTNILTNIGKEK